MNSQKYENKSETAAQGDIMIPTSLALWLLRVQLRQRHSDEERVRSELAIRALSRMVG